MNKLAVAVLLVLTNISFGDIAVSSGNNFHNGYYHLDEEERFLMKVIDSDPNAIITIKNLPSGAALIDSVFTWTPTRKDNGIYNIVFESSNENVYYNDFAVVRVFVSNTKRTVYVGEGYSCTYTSFGPDGYPMEITVDEIPVGSTWSGTQYGPKTLVWTPSMAQLGYHALTLTVIDSPASGIPVEDKSVMVFEVINLAPDKPEVYFSDLNNNQRIDVKDFEILSRYWLRFFFEPVELY